MFQTTRISVSLAIALALAGLSAASPVGFDPTGDAGGDFAALSGTGDASSGYQSDGCDYGVGTPCIGLVAASLTGDARADYLAVSGTGDADGGISVCASDPRACQRFGTISVPVVTGAAAGPDADGDGVPSFLAVRSQAMIVDLDAGTVTPGASSEIRQSIDLNDANADFPVPDPDGVALPDEASVVAPTGVALGPDADGDGIPSAALVGFSRVTVHGDGTIDVAPIAPTVVKLDPNDADPRPPVPNAPTTIRQTIPTGVVLGPDGDGDGIPGSAAVARAELVVDFEQGAVTLTPTRETRTAVDADDTSREVDVQAEGDAEGSVIALSLTGDATSCGPRLTCFAVSGTGDASGYWAVSGTGDATSCADFDFLCTAASGTGDATADDYAVSGLGDASGNDGAVSGAGDARSVAPVSALGTCDGEACAAADAASASGRWLAVGVDGATGLVAVGIFGPADGGLVGASLFGAASGPVAVSGCDAVGIC